MEQQTVQIKDVSTDQLKILYFDNFKLSQAYGEVAHNCEQEIIRRLREQHEHQNQPVEASQAPTDEIVKVD